MIHSIQAHIPYCSFNSSSVLNFTKDEGSEKFKHLQNDFVDLQNLNILSLIFSYFLIAVLAIVTIRYY